MKKQNLNLKNKTLILSSIKQFCVKNGLDSIDFMNKMYKTISEDSEEFSDMDLFLVELQNKLNYNNIYDTEEELFHCISFELNRIYTEEVMKNSDQKSIDDVNEFIRNNYYTIFSDYFNKKGYINESDYSECALSIQNNFNIEIEIVDILLGEFISNNIINI